MRVVTLKMYVNLGLDDLLEPGTEEGFTSQKEVVKSSAGYVEFENMKRIRVKAGRNPYKIKV
jgi:hypothetical protein